MLDRPWTAAPLVVVDLEGTGAQDREQEAILEVALIPLSGGRLDMSTAFTSLINPGRPVPRRPWISPGINDAVLRDAPAPSEIDPELVARLDGVWLVGHNVGVDWRLLHLRHPSVDPAGLIDTLRIARSGHGRRVSLTSLVDEYSLRDDIDRLVPDGRPHRALWDAAATGLLLAKLVTGRWNVEPTLGELLAAGGPSTGPAAGEGVQEQLW
ncbi:DNA polymerase-3 subunit epsilon/exodeoxyribonuclease X [Sinosporangium album]|uniref:DNA polymerase-3 subunit epsilon/exodeoxyribonuclease X n=1 Tax=Sinosporangium album TaxID=504805 RepID=A0A1G7ZJB3_9ACTN|nr:3'-5' exonuclease [Sinosporangium album]SDH08788.1 DNA polymerase-3 subunit epsilon/exodeoxyribonuclease X [Sinosporangium album]